MRNRVHRPAHLNHSARFKREHAELQRAQRDPFIASLYDTPEWQVLRARVRREADGRCQWPGCAHSGRVVDHRTPHRGNRELFFARSNLWLLCKVHHDRKTARHDGGFGNPRAPLIWPAAPPGGPRRGG